MMGEKRKLTNENGGGGGELNWSSSIQSSSTTDQFQTSSWMKTCPSGGVFPLMKKMIYCFICGNGTCEGNTVLIHSRQHETSQPFFPFMEYHDPAPGAEPMLNYSVICCFVCNAFLIQQWHSFERYKTPINKRLYWLKRPSGCEIRQPVSQIELEEMLNENVRDSVGGDQCDSDEPNIPPPPPPTTTNKHHKSSSEKQPVESPPPPPLQKTNIHVVNCYCCGEEKQLNVEVCRIYTCPSYEQMRVGVPYYPTTLQLPKKTSQQQQQNSITFMCISCLPKFPPQWHQLQKDFLKQFPSTTSTSMQLLPRIPLPETVSCYTCNEMIDTKYNDHLITLTSTIKKLLESKQMSPHSVPLKLDFTYLCHDCMTSVKKESASDVTQDKCAVDE